MAWIYLIIGGLFEVGFTISLKYSENFSKLIPSLSFLVCAVLSFVFLNKAANTLPIGTAYAVWTGIGAAGTAVAGMLFFKEPVEAWRLFFLCLLIGSVIGLKLVAKE